MRDPQEKRLCDYLWNLIHARCFPYLGYESWLAARVRRLFRGQREVPARPTAMGGCAHRRVLVANPPFIDLFSGTGGLVLAFSFKVCDGRVDS